MDYASKKAYKYICAIYIYMMHNGLGEYTGVKCNILLYYCTDCYIGHLLCSIVAPPPAPIGTPGCQPPVVPDNYILHIR